MATTSRVVFATPTSENRCSAIQSKLASNDVPVPRWGAPQTFARSPIGGQGAAHATLEGHRTWSPPARLGGSTLPSLLAATRGLAGRYRPENFSASCREVQGKESKCGGMPRAETSSFGSLVWRPRIFRLRPIINISSPVISLSSLGNFVVCQNSHHLHFLLHRCFEFPQVVSSILSSQKPGNCAEE